MGGATRTSTYRQILTICSSLPHLRNITYHPLHANMDPLTIVEAIQWSSLVIVYVIREMLRKTRQGNTTERQSNTTQLAQGTAFYATGGTVTLMLCLLILLGHHDVPWLHTTPPTHSSAVATRIPWPQLSLRWWVKCIEIQHFPWQQ